MFKLLVAGAFILLPCTHPSLFSADSDFQIIRVRKLRSNAYFPDLTLYQESLFITYRQANHHTDKSHGKVVVLKSDDGGNTWPQAARLVMPRADLRDQVV